MQNVIIYFSETGRLGTFEHSLAFFWAFFPAQHHKGTVRCSIVILWGQQRGHSAFGRLPSEADVSVHTLQHLTPRTQMATNTVAGASIWLFFGTK